MSDDAMRWARQQRAGGVTDKALLEWLAKKVGHAHHSTYCSVQDIARSLEVSERTVHNVYARLVRRRLLRVLRRGSPGGGRGWSRLQLLVDGPDTPLPPHEDWTGVYDPDAEAAKARARKAARAGQPPAETGSKPATDAGLVEAHPGGQTCTICRNEPATVAGSNLHDVQVPSNKEEKPLQKPLPPPPVTPDTPAPPAAGGRDEDEDRHPEPAAVDVDAAHPVLDRLSAEARIGLAGWQRARLLRLIAAALTAGWPPGGLVREIHRGGDLGSAENPYGALRWRLQQLGPPPVAAVPDPPPPAATCPEGRCDGSGRYLVDGDVDQPALCTACHPRYRRPAAG